MFGKKASHVGIVLSFVIFVTFLIFLFSIIQPVTNVETGKQDLVKYLKTELVKEFIDDLTISTLSIDYSGGGCIKIDVVEGTENLGVIVKDTENEKLLNSSIKNKKLEIKIDGSKSLKVSYSSQFEIGNNLPDCIEIGNNDYVTGLTRTESQIFSSKIINLSEFMSSVENYEKVKDKLKIPLGDNFGFIFEDGNRISLAKTQEKEVQTNIYSEEISIRYVDEQANIK